MRFPILIALLFVVVFDEKGKKRKLPNPDDPAYKKQSDQAASFFFVVKLLPICIS